MWRRRHSMKTKRRFTIVALLITAGALIAGAPVNATPGGKQTFSTAAPQGTTDPPAKKAEDTKVTTLRLVCGLPVAHPVTKSMELFKKEVEARTNGKIKISLYPGGELYGHKDIARVIPMGAVEMAICQAAHLGGLNPLGYYSALYFAIPTLERWEEAKGVILSIWDKSFNKKNIKVIAPIYYGASGFAVRKKLVRTPEDVKGLRLRGPTKAHIMCIQSWGAIGVSLAASEVYDAMSKGSIDGTVTGWSTFYSRGFSEVANYFSGPTYQSVWILVMNLKTWNALTKEQQKVISDSGADMWAFTKDEGLKYDNEAIAYLRKTRNVHIFTAEEIQEWMKATKPAYDEMLKRCKDAGYEKEALEILRVLKVPGY
jgi:TRAP-type C4-dicarboxylate transport system substrate-binding protein